MSIIKNVIRGGQTNLHSVRMSVQIFRSALLVSIVFGMVYFSIKSYVKIPSSAWGQYYEYRVAKMTISIISSKKQIRTTEQLYYPVSGKPYKRKVQSIVNDYSLRKISNLLERSLEKFAIESMKVSTGVFLLIFLFWGSKGYFGKKKEHKRGIEILELAKLKKKLILKGIASDIKIGPLPLVKNSETSHILIAGTTGAGKSNCFNLLIDQIRDKNQQSIIFDPTGEYVAKFYREDKDHILNPFDVRGENWHIWSEYETTYELERIASAIIPDRKSLDPFWIEAARALFVYSAGKFQLKEQHSAQEFVSFLLNSSPNILRDQLSNTPIAPLLDKENNKQLLSIKSTLMTYIRCFEYLEDTQDGEKTFSITNWVKQEDQDSLLFVTCKASQRAVLRPLISAWIDISIAALMDLSPDDKRRCWFFIDELPALQKLPSLRIALAESRKYGGCIVAGMQSLNQMSEIYGHEEAKAMLNMFNTEIYFRMVEANNREMISRALGDAEETEYLENISYGANTMRDGVSAYSQTRMKRLVTASELRHLEDLEAFIHLPKVESITKLKMPYAGIKNVEKSFCQKEVGQINYKTKMKHPSSRKAEEKVHDIENLISEIV